MVKKITVSTQDDFGKIVFNFYNLKDLSDWINSNSDKNLEDIKKEAFLYFMDEDKHR